MSNLSLFMKQNKKIRPNTKYAATKSLVDENGNPLEFEIRSLTTKEDELIREQCTKEVPIVGKPGAFRQKIDSNAYISKMTAAAIVFPNLNNAELQDSYGVKKPEDLLKELIDDPGEFQDLCLFVQKNNGFTNLDSRVDEAKN